MEEIYPQTIEEATRLVYNTLNQGDSRYNNPEAERTLALFILKKAISVKENPFPKLSEPKQEEISKHFVQGWEKQIAKTLLKIRGFDDLQIFFEKRFLGSVPDVMAEKENLVVIVECCSCRVDKIIEYLSKVDEVWVLTRGEKPWEERLLFEKMQWFIFQKSVNWNKIYNNLQKERMEDIKKIKSPFDNL